jgi:hypothetical protein
MNLEHGHVWRVQEVNVAMAVEGWCKHFFYVSVLGREEALPLGATL